MNRRERRAASKRLGILQYQQKLPLNKKFELIRENIVAGKQRQKELRKELGLKEVEEKETKESKEIYNMAESIIKGEKIPFGEAIKKATNTYNKPENNI